MAARVAGVPMPSASVRIFLTAGLLTNLATPHMAAMSDASLKGFGGRVRLPVTVTSSAVTAWPSRSAGKGAVASFSFSSAAGSPPTSPRRFRYLLSTWAFDEAMADRLDGHTRFFAWRLHQGALGREMTKENDAADLRFIVHLGEGFLLLSGDASFVRFVDESGTHQVPWFAAFRILMTPCRTGHRGEGALTKQPARSAAVRGPCRRAQHSAARDTNTMPRVDEIAAAKSAFASHGRRRQTCGHGCSCASGE
jgi:hypothetical protein